MKDIIITVLVLSLAFVLHTIGIWIVWEKEQAKKDNTLYRIHSKFYVSSYCKECHK